MPCGIAMHVMGERFRAIPVDAGVLDLSRREDIAEVERRLSSVEARPYGHHCDCAESGTRAELAGLSGEAASARAVRFDHLLAALAAERRARIRGMPVRARSHRGLGKHTDYGGGRSLICAAERGFHVVSAPRTDRRLAITDLGRGTALMLDADGPPPDVSWATYPHPSCAVWPGTSRR